MHASFWSTILLISRFSNVFERLVLKNGFGKCFGRVYVEKKFWGMLRSLFADTYV